jgi:hypothetical protein
MGDHALLVSLAWELSKMGLLKRIATQDELLSLGIRQTIVRPVFLAGCVAFGAFAASGLAPHLGQATTSFFRS